MITKVAVSILNYNSLEDTVACVDSLLGLNDLTELGVSLSIFVADNHSDHIQQALILKLSEYPEVTFIQHERNCGFSVGHNRNLKVIFKQGSPDFVWVLNNDCLVEKEALNSLIACARKHTDVAIWGASIIEKKGGIVQCAGGCYYNPWLSTYSQYGNGKKEIELSKLKVPSFDYASGASLFFPASLMQTAFEPSESNQPNTDPKPLFNEIYFLYFEELDLAKRLKPEFTMAWCKEAVIRHTGGVSAGTESGKSSQLAEYHSSLSALKFTRLYYPRRLWLMAPARYLLKCLQLIMKGKFRLIRQLTRAYRDFWFSKPTDNS